MYYEEKVIDGVLHWRSNPKDEFKPYTAEELSTLLVEVRERVGKAQAALAGL